MPMIRGATKRVRDDARIVDGCVAGDVVVGLPRATGIQAEMAKGALLCRLAETLEGAHLGDTHRRPKVKAEAKVSARVRARVRPTCGPM